MSTPERVERSRAADDVARYREHWQDEVDGAALYRAMAAGEEDEGLAGVYRRLAAVEDDHARFWAERLAALGEPPGEASPSWRARVLSFVATRFGASIVAPVVAEEEALGQRRYDDEHEAAGTSLSADERSHARLLRQVVRPTASGLAGGAIARLEGRHRTVGSNALRAGVLGANDGLVSNLSLVLGVAGASVGDQAVVVAGVAGLLAGASSMALGEWISVQSAREAAERQLRIEADEIREFPDEEREELRLIYEAKGLPAEQAREVADRLLSEPATALDAMAREELGIDPDDLGGSPWQAAGYSFVLFALGAVVPVLPFLVGSGAAATLTAVAASGAALFVLGLGISVLTGRSAWWSGLRQLAIGLATGAVTYGVGTALGVAIA